MSLLITDDEPHMLHLLEYNLRDLSLPIYTATNGEETLRAFETWKGIEVLVIDYGLPDHHGLEVVSRLRGQGYRFAALLITARGQKDLDATLVDAYLTKPFSPMALQAEVKRMLKAPYQST